MYILFCLHPAFFCASVSSSRRKSLWIDKTIRQSAEDMTDDAGSQSQDNTEIEKGIRLRRSFQSRISIFLKDNLSSWIFQ